MKRFFIILSILLFASSTVHSQGYGIVFGHIEDEITHHPLIRANVTIEGTNLGAATDTKGNFIIEHVSVGDVDVTVSMLGYRTSSRKEITVSAGKIATVDFQLISEPIQMEQVTITALRDNQYLYDVPVSTEIISSAALRRSTPQNIGEALESVSGLYLKNYGNSTALKTISIRGSSDNQVLVLLDGQRLNNSQNSSVDFSWIPIDDVDKIEIVRGGHSALYGADAVGGIVNIITKTPLYGQKFSSRIRSTIGSFGTQIYTIDGEQSLGRFGYYLSLKQIKSEGDYAFTDNQGVENKLENNDLDAKNVFVKLNCSYSNYSNVTFTSHYYDSEKGLQGSITYPNPVGRMHETKNFYNLAVNDNTFQRLSIKANIYHHRTDDDVDHPDAWTLKSLHKNRALGVELQNRYILNKYVVLTYGYDYRHDKLISSSTQNQRRTSHSLYVQTLIDKRLDHVPLLDKISLVPALRYDNYSDVGAQTSPKLGVALNRNGLIGTVVRANVGKSFRIPTFNDLYWPDDGFFVGNTNLKPEIGTNYDAGTVIQFNHKTITPRFEFTYFVNNLEDLIIWEPRSDGKYTPQNIDRAKIKGMETSLAFNIFRQLVSLKLGHTYLNAMNTSSQSGVSGKYLVYRPKHKVDFGLSCHVNIAYLQLMYRYVDKSYTNPGNTKPLPEYCVFDVSAHILPKIMGVEIMTKFDILNVFNRKYFVIDDYPMAGRQFRLTVSLRN